MRRTGAGNDNLREDCDREGVYGRQSTSTDNGSYFGMSHFFGETQTLQVAGQCTWKRAH